MTNKQEPNNLAERLKAIRERLSAAPSEYEETIEIITDNIFYKSLKFKIGTVMRLFGVDMTVVQVKVVPESVSPSETIFLLKLVEHYETALKSVGGYLAGTGHPDNYAIEALKQAEEMARGKTDE